MALAVDIMHGHALSNEMHTHAVAAKEYYVLAVNAKAKVLCTVHRLSLFMASCNSAFTSKPN